MGLLDRLKERLTRTRTALSDGITGIFRGGKPIDEHLLGDLEALLYGSDLGPIAATVTAELARLHKRGEIRGEDDVRRALRAILLERLAQDGGEIAFTHKPLVILVVGVNGSGKTTSIAKLGARFARQGKRVLLGAGDTFRAAAADQLEIWAQRNGAARWLSLAARKGHAGAQAKLGNIMFNGDGIDPNPEEGLMWLTVASRRAAGTPDEGWINELLQNAMSVANPEQRQRGIGLADTLSPKFGGLAAE